MVLKGWRIGDLYFFSMAKKLMADAADITYAADRIRTYA